MTDSLQNRRSTQAPTASIPPFGLRMQSVLKAELEASAEASGRSLNAEIVDRLRQSFETMFELDPELLEQLEQYAVDHGVSTSKALKILLMSGLRDAGSKIVHINLRQGATIAELSEEVARESQKNPLAEVHFSEDKQTEKRAIGAEIQSVTGGGVVRIVQRIDMGK